MFYEWRPYVSAAERRRKAYRKTQELKKIGQSMSPVVIDGRNITQTFWGNAWCDNLERYSDYSNRLPRGRTYVRNGSVIDLQVKAGEVAAIVSGSSLYTVSIKVSALPEAQWASICRDSAGAIESLVELLQGRFSKGVMERICREKTGLFPSPEEIKLACSCPDWASMCKHVAAVLYGVGARLDEQPDLLFKLRNVDEKDLIAKAGSGLPLAPKGPSDAKVLVGDSLSELFGLEMVDDAAAEANREGKAKPGRRRGGRAAPTLKTSTGVGMAKSKGKPKPRATARRASPSSRPKSG